MGNFHLNMHTYKIVHIYTPTHTKRCIDIKKKLDSAVTRQPNPAFLFFFIFHTLLFISYTFLFSFNLISIKRLKIKYSVFFINLINVITMLKRNSIARKTIIVLHSIKIHISHRCIRIVDICWCWCCR